MTRLFAKAVGAGPEVRGVPVEIVPEAETLDRFAAWFDQISTNDGPNFGPDRYAEVYIDRRSDGSHAGIVTMGAIIAKYRDAIRTKQDGGER